MNNSKKFLASNVVNILNALDDGVYVTDKQGTTLYVNSMYNKLTGLKTEELLGKNVRELKQKGIFDTILNPVIVKTHRSETGVQTLQDGKRVSLRGFPVFDDNKELVLVVTLVRDVTLIEQLRDQISSQKKLLSVCRRRVELLVSKADKNGNALEIPPDEKLSEQIDRVASTDKTILLMGERGLGKNRIARLVHERSPRKDEIFLEFDCGGISGDRIEQELFGCIPEPLDAFTSSNNEEEIGLFESADKGTVFLKEIGEMPMATQAKLLKLLQDGEVPPVGSPVARKVDVRIVAATDASIQDVLKKGDFRQDLYDKIHEAVVDIPPLRETPEAIPELAERFVKWYAKKYKKDIACPDETMSLLAKYKWPGNVAELENTIQNLVVSCEEDKIPPHDLPPRIASNRD